MNRLIVIDTNVIVSAALNSKGHSSHIISSALAGDLIVALCPTIAREYSAVLARPEIKRFELAPIWLNVLISQAHFMPHDPARWAFDGSVSDDLIFLDMAAHVGAMLITGNTKHFPKSVAKHVDVLRPAEYVSMLLSE